MDGPIRPTTTAQPSTLGARGPYRTPHIVAAATGGKALVIALAAGLPRGR
ncbi:MAG TPA: hypothetical protein VHN80_22995 [Kineosporiaceae bacterium]|nr:hypothetical protein [Kineosporiaceae bacterium]